MLARKRSSPPGRIPVVLLGLNVPGLAAARSLGRAGVPVRGLDSTPGAPGFWSRYCDAALCPDPLREPERLVAVLLEEARRDDRPVLICSSDEFVSFLATHRDLLAEAYRFTLPPPALNEFLVNKRRQHELAARLGMPHPLTFCPETASEVRRLAPSLPYPVFMKPCEGHLWRQRFRGEAVKGLKLHTPAELVRAYETVADAGLPVVIQSIVAGPPTNLLEVCAYIGNDGGVRAVFTDGKLRQYPVEFGIGTLNVSIDCPELEDVGVRFLRDIGYRGFAALEFKRDASDGQLKLIELNPRLTVQNGLAADCGVNFPLIEYRHLTGEEERAAPGFEVGVRWWNAPDDLKAFLASRRDGTLPLGEWLRSWIGARSFAAFAWDDPLPMLAWYTARLLRALLGKLPRRAPAPPPPGRDAPHGSSDPVTAGARSS